jgi:cytochrome b involved in lipid metabolism
VSNFRSHPGGRVILSALGAPDSTDVFNAFHPGKTHELLKDFYVGDLDTRSGAPLASEANVSVFEKEYRAMAADMRAKGLYKAK